MEIALYGLGGRGPCQNMLVHYSGLYKVNDFSSFMAMSSLLRQTNLISSRIGATDEASWFVGKNGPKGFPGAAGEPLDVSVCIVARNSPRAAHICIYIFYP